MAEYAQINPGKYHLGFRFPTPVIIDKLPMNAEDDHRIDLKYKHAVIAGRTLYVGNVQVFARRNGSIKVEGDSMYKSIVNQFDVFADFNKIEAAVNDGEEITALAEFADKILQFKQNTLYIINISQQVEILEFTYKHKGVNNPAAVCKTDYGIAWANEHGCFIYDGKNVTDLLERQGVQKVKQSDWQSFIVNPMVGYFPRKRQLMVVDDITTGGDGSIYLYDMVTTSWVKGSAATYADAVKSNLINDWNGDLVHATGAIPKKWSDTSVAKTIYFFTKDVDFEQPGIKKKIYKAYISYKGDGSSLTVKYGVNGETHATDLFSFDSSLLDKSSAENLESWHLAELKPNTSSQANNIYSFQIFIYGSAGETFEINDISIIYRLKSVK